MSIRRILLNWDIGSFLTSKRVEAGDVNRNWVVTTTEGKYVLRRVAPYRTVKDLSKTDENTATVRLQMNRR
jgi:Ser/Thr protein kinase RdoA (MazF antagonist)